MLHRHEKLGFELLAPDGWKLIDESEHGLVLEAVTVDGAHNARVAVTAEPAAAGEDLAAATTRALSSEARTAASVRLIDRVDDRIATSVAERVLLHREVEERAVTVEQWRGTTSRAAA